ncbi:MAG: DUF6335 family protein [Nostochopsis sp.]
MVDPNIQQNYQAQEDLEAQLNQVAPDKQAQEENLPPQISDLPEKITESYGTGVKDKPGYNIGDRKLRDQIQNNRQSSPTITGGDNDMLEQRDDRRWELDPKSSEDYKERRE